MFLFISLAFVPYVGVLFFLYLAALVVLLNYLQLQQVYPSPWILLLIPLSLPLQRHSYEKKPICSAVMGLC